MNARRNVARALAIAGTAAVVAGGLATQAHAAGSLTINSGSPALNTGSHTITVTGTGPYVPNAPVNFTLTGPAGDTITASGTATSTTTATATPDFTQHNPGQYNVALVQGQAISDSCNSCLLVTAFAPTVTSVSPNTLGEGTTPTFTTASGLQPFVINGSSFTHGPYTGCAAIPCTGPSILIYRDGGNTVADPSVSLLPTVNSNGATAPTSTTATTITLRVNVQGADTAPYVDDIVVTNSDGKTAVCSQCLTISPQPSISEIDVLNPLPGQTSLAPLHEIGQNASNMSVDVYGDNFPSDAVVSFAPPTANDTTDAITYSGHTAPAASPVAGGDLNRQVIHLTGVNTTGVTSGGVGTWTAFVSSPSLHARGSKPFPVQAAPAVSSPTYPDSSTGAYGQGAQGVRLAVPVTNGVAGTNGLNNTTNQPHTLVAFPGAPANGWITSEDASVAGTVTALLNIPSNANVGGPTAVQAFNPDGGVSALCSTSGLLGSSPCGLTVAGGPTLASATPNNASPGSSVATIHVTGTGFHTGTNGMTLSVIDTTTSPATLIGSAPVTATSATAGDTTSALSIPGGTTVKGYELLLTNNSDKGASGLANGFNVVNFTAANPIASPTNTNVVTNDTTYTITMTGAGIPSDASIQLHKTGVPTLSGSQAASVTGNGSTISQAFNLVDVAPGVYDAQVTSPTEGTSGCSQCFTIQGQTPTLTSVTPAAVGAGAQNFSITVVGTHFYDGSSLTFSNAHVHAVGTPQVTKHTDLGHADDTSILTQTVSVDPGTAADNAGTVKVTNTDGSNSGTKPFAVDAGPSISDTSYPAHAGGQSFPLTVNGSNFASNAVLTFSNGSITATYDRANSSATKLVATITAPASVASNGPATIHMSVVNPSDGGQAAAPDLTIDPLPTVSSTNPAKLIRGSSSTTLQVLGSNFTPQAVVSSPDANVVVTKSTYVSSSEVDALVNVPSSATTGVHDLSLDNGDGGTATVPVTVIGVPSAPTNLTAVGQPGGLSVSWGAPTDNGGDAITGYTVSLTKQSDGSSAGSATTDSSTLGHSFTGLTNGALYDVSVVAINHAGNSPAATTQGTPTSSGVLGAPRQLSASARDGKVVLSWLPPSSSGGSAIDHYTVFVSPGNAQVQTTGTSVTVTNLHNGTLYSFDVTAHNSNGNGPASGFVSARPKFVTSLSLHRSHTSVRSGGKLVLSGKLLRSNGSGRGNATVRLYRKIGSGSYVRIASFKTGSRGGWSRTLHPKKTARYYVAFSGDGADRSSKSSSSRVSVH